MYPSIQLKVETHHCYLLDNRNCKPSWHRETPTCHISFWNVVAYKQLSSLIQRTSQHQYMHVFCLIYGATENGWPENAGPSKMQGWKRRTGKRRTIIRGWKTRDQLLWNAEAAKRQGIYCTVKNVQALLM